MVAVEILLTLLAAALLVPVLVLFTECLAALLPLSAPTEEPPVERGRIDVLIPAHDEESWIPSTIGSLQPQLAPGDRLVVVADNCTDRTAAVAEAAGAIVVERRDSERTGKGYALAHGLSFLEESPPAAVVLIDADCEAHEGALDHLVRKALATGRPVQAAYILEPPAGANPLGQVSAFACLVKNVVRPRGLERLGLPCPITGSGIALPWPLVGQATLGSGELVEDLNVGLDLALAGHPPLFCSAALVTSPLPAGKQARASQRKRWEHGQLGTLLARSPRLVKAAWKQRRWDLLAIALDLSVLPLSLLSMMTFAALGAAAAAAFLGLSWLPVSLLAAASGLLVVSISLAWVAFGRGRYPITSLLLAPLYALWKLPLYVGFLLRRQRAWVRTERGPKSP
jgi:glycosyltransferase involved in cell wall biosynthesis